MSGTTPSGNNNGNNSQHSNNGGNDAQQHISRPQHMHPGQHLESIGNGGIKTDDSASHHQYSSAQQQGHPMMMPAMNTPGLSEEDSEDHSQADKTTERKPGRRKINIEFIDDKSRRHITFSKRKAGIMKKAYELSALTGTQVLLLVASETGHVYTFATPKLQPLITKPEGKNLIQTCLNAPDIPQMPTGGPPVNNSQRRNTGFADPPYPEPDLGGITYGGTGAGGYISSHQTPQMRQYQTPNPSASTPLGARYQQESSMAGGGGAGGYGGYGGQAGVGTGGAAGAGGAGGYPQGMEQDYGMMSGQYGGSAWHGNPGGSQHMAHMHPQHQGQMSKMSTEAQLQQLGNTSLPS